MHDSAFHDANALPTHPRDRTYDRIVGRLLEGTPKPGETLDVAELISVVDSDREAVERALERLRAERFVESGDAAGTYRVAVPTPSDVDHALQVLFGFAELAARWAVPTMADADLELMSGSLDDVRRAADDRSVNAFNFAVDAIVGPLLTATPNPLFEQAALLVLEQSRILFLARPDAQYWGLRNHVDAFQAALRSRDGEAAAAGIRSLGRALQVHLDELRAAAAQGAGTSD